MKIKKSISGGAVLLLALIYFLGGIRSLAALMLAVAAHESGHIIFIRILGGKVRGIRFGASGFCIDYSGLNEVAGEFTAILAGPLCGIAFALIVSKLGNIYQNSLLLETAGLSFLLSAYNLLPALPLDGGRLMLLAMTVLFGSEKAEVYIENSGMLTGLVLTFAGLYFLGKVQGAAFLIAGIWVLIAQTGIVKSMRVL